MKKTLLALATVFALFGCQQPQTDIKPTQDNKTFKLTVELVSEGKIVDFCQKLGVPYMADGCTRFDNVTKECTIYVMPPRALEDVERFALVGHEVWHCRYGKWHS